MRERDDHFIDEDDERNRILEAIEQQAKTLSMARGGGEHRLSDWLTAAEDVMPEIRKPMVKPMSMSGTGATAVAAPASNSKNMLGMIAAGTVVLAMAGGGGMAYMQLMQQMQAVEKVNQQLTKRLTEIEKAMTEAQKSDGASKVAIAADGKVEVVANKDPLSAQFLDARLQAQTSQLEQNIDDKFRQILDKMEGRSTSIAPMMVPQVQTTAAMQQMQSNVRMPVTPQVVEMQPQQTLAMTQPISNAPVQMQMAMPTVQAAPVVAQQAAPADAMNTWLYQQNPESLVLQLGSNPKAEGLEQMARKIRQNGDMAHVLSLKANGAQRYILVYGAFANRDDAKKATDSIKNDLGVTAWVRRVGDVKTLIDRQ